MDQDELMRQLELFDQQNGGGSQIDFAEFLGGMGGVGGGDFASAAAMTMKEHNYPLIDNLSSGDGNETNDDDSDELLEDETIVERLQALKEMFPERVQSFFGKLNDFACETTKVAMKKAKIATWWCASSFTILIFPILVQKELLQIAEQISREHRSILLGPQATISGGGIMPNI